MRKLNIIMLVIWFCLEGATAWASGVPHELSWGDLIPEGAPDEAGPPRASEETGTGGFLDFGRFFNPLADPEPEEPSAPLNHAYDGQTVRIPGYAVPLDFQATTLTEFLLVPYVGACIHVPPPPANQMLFVELDEGTELRGLFDPVYVTGTLTAHLADTALGEAGYHLEATGIEPYQ